MITISMNPILSLGPLHMRWYGIMVMLAALTVLLWTWRAARKGGVSEDTVFTAALWAIPFGFIGARLFEVVDKLDYYLNHPNQIISAQGLSVYGAILGAVFGVWIYSRVRAFPFWRFVDLAAPGIILGQAVGRIGCIINGCCPGIPTTLPWGLVYTHPDSYATLGQAGHPAVGYEMGWDLLVFALLMRLRGKLKPEGSLFLVYLSVYSFGRFFITYFRVGTYFVPGLHQAQLIALLVLAIAVPLLAYRTGRAKRQQRPA